MHQRPKRVYFPIDLGKGKYDTVAKNYGSLQISNKLGTHLSKTVIKKWDEVNLFFGHFHISAFPPGTNILENWK